MGIMPNMENIEGKKTYVRTTPAIKAELKRVVIDLGQARAFASRQHVLAQEVVVAASWLWMRQMDADVLAEHLAPFVARVESEKEFIREEEPVRTVTGVDEGKPGEPASRDKRKRGRSVTY